MPGNTTWHTSRVVLNIILYGAPPSYTAEDSLSAPLTVASELC